MLRLQCACRAVCVIPESGPDFWVAWTRAGKGVLRAFLACFTLVSSAYQRWKDLFRRWYRLYQRWESVGNVLGSPSPAFVKLRLPLP